MTFSFSVSYLPFFQVLPVHIYGGSQSLIQSTKSQYFQAFWQLSLNLRQTRWWYTWKDTGSESYCISGSRADHILHLKSHGLQKPRPVVPVVNWLAQGNSVCRSALELWIQYYRRQLEQNTLLMKPRVHLKNAEAKFLKSCFQNLFPANFSLQYHLWLVWLLYENSWSLLIKHSQFPHSLLLFTFTAFLFIASHVEEYFLKLNLITLIMLPLFHSIFHLLTML